MEIANIFNNFFSRQCQHISNHSILPLTLSFETTNYLSKVDVRSEKILKITKTLDQIKAAGDDKISVTMPKICGLSIIKSLCLQFNNYVRRSFPNTWKIANVHPVHKKAVNNY